MPKDLLEAVQALKDRGVTSEAIAKEFGISQQAICSMLKSRRIKAAPTPVVGKKAAPTPEPPSHQGDQETITLTIDGVKLTFDARDLKKVIAALKEAR